MALCIAEPLFSPVNVIGHFRRLPLSFRTDPKRSKAYRKAQEASFVAEMLAGRRSADKTDYWLRIIGDGEQSPDIKTYAWKKSGKSPDGMWEHFVEVTEYEDHSQEPLIDFLDRTKLHKYKHDPMLIILCRITRYAHIPSHMELKRKLVERKVVNPVLLCGPSTDATFPETDHTLIEFNPAQGAPPAWVRFNLDKELSTMDRRGVLVLDKRRRPGYFPNEKNYPFQQLGFVPDRDGSYS